MTPDAVRVGKDGKVTERRYGNKDVAVRPSQSGGTEEVSVPPATAREHCLDDQTIYKLIDLAERCEMLFGDSLDIEWALANGEVHLLQCRPITR